MRGLQGQLPYCAAILPDRVISDANISCLR